MSSGKFEDPVTGKSFGDIRSLRCNCDGTRASVLASHKVTEKSR
jgi:hypothetical protein